MRHDVMKKRWLAILSVFVAAFLFILFILFQNSSAAPENKGYQSTEKNQAAETEADGNAEQDEECPEQNDNEEFCLVENKIELTDFAELPIEEFIKTTEIPLFQEEEGSWKTEDNSIRAKTDNDKITCLSISLFTGDIEGDKRLEQLIKAGKFPYTIAGINLNDSVSYLESTILKSASRVSSGGIGRDYYTSLDLSGLGIEKLTIANEGIVGGITADFDMSLKESADGLEYIWGEKIRQKEGEKNDRLAIPEDFYMKIPGNYKQPGNIEKTIVSIKYPCLEIPGNPETEQNANSLILDTVKKIEDKTYRNTDENMVVEADYFITYITSRFISITFKVEVSDNDGTRRGPWQYCNINIDNNGKGATLADVGITREEIAVVCGAYREPLDTEAYLEKYDESWDQYNIKPTEYWIHVPTLNEENGFSDKDFTAHVRIYRYWVS